MLCTAGGTGGNISKNVSLLFNIGYEQLQNNSIKLIQLVWPKMVCAGERGTSLRVYISKNSLSGLTHYWFPGGGNELSM